MASTRTAQPTAALVGIGSIQTTVVIFDAACGTRGTRQWLIILIFRSDGRIVHIGIGVVRMDKMKLDPARFEPARRVGVQP
jgi:hypothetical protein